jgi:hypothetical protein
MGGGLLQLVAYGAQDVYLTGNPQITFFKVVYRRHTNFAIEAIEQTFNGTAGYGQRVTCQISRNGDLIHRVYLQVDLGATNTDYLCKFFGLRLINYVELEIGGQRIDKHYSHWLYIWNELSLPISKRIGYNDMVGAYGGRVYTGSAVETTNPINRILYVPLEFWFCRNVGLALPLIALQYHEVKININFEAADKCAGTIVTSVAAPPVVSTTTPTKSFTASLWVDYIFLDTDERRRFAQLSHEYLIEQLQFTGQESISNTTVKPKLSFNHPVKELIWVITTNNADNNNWMNYTTTADDSPSTVAMPKRLVTVTDTNSTYLTYTDNNYHRIKDKLQPMTNSDLNHTFTAKLSLNGNDRFTQRQGSYFNLIQPFQHHENIPTNAGINVYSFALKPEEHQPSGTLNMSRIDSAVLSLDLDHKFPSGYIFTNKNYSSGYSLNVYAVNYNVLRILSGMGGLAYSN